MFCSKCGKENPDNSKFCMSCGNSFQTAAVKEASQPNNPQSHALPQNKKPHRFLIPILAIVGVLIIAGIIIAFMSNGGSSGDSEAINIVKAGHLNYHAEKMVGEAVDGFFADPKWESGVEVDGDTKGKTLVNATGKITFLGKEVEATLQFVVDEGNDSFTWNAFEMNGIPQNNLMKSGLLQKMYGVDASQGLVGGDQAEFVGDGPNTDKD